MGAQLAAATVAVARNPWMLPVLGLALFVHRFFIAAEATCSSRTLGRRPRSDGRPAKQRRAPRARQTARVVSEDSINEEVLEQQRLSAVGLGSERMREWFTEDELEGLQQAQARSPGALIDLLCHGSGAQMLADGGSSEWMTDDDEDDERGAYVVDGTALQQQVLALHGTVPRNAHQGAAKSSTAVRQQQVGNSEPDEGTLPALLPQLRLSRLVQAANQNSSSGESESDDAHPSAREAGAASRMQAELVHDYFDPADVFGLTPRAGAVPPPCSPGLPHPPHIGAMWPGSLPRTDADELPGWAAALVRSSARRRSSESREGPLVAQAAGAAATQGVADTATRTAAATTAAAAATGCASASDDDEHAGGYLTRPFGSIGSDADDASLLDALGMYGPPDFDFDLELDADDFDIYAPEFESVIAPPDFEVEPPSASSHEQQLVALSSLWAAAVDPLQAGSPAAHAPGG